MAWLSSLLAILLEWLCHSVWLFHLHSTVKRQPFSPVFPLAESITEAFFWLFLWNFKEKSINHFLGHSLWNLKGGTGSCWLWRSLEEKGGVFFRGREDGRPGKQRLASRCIFPYDLRKKNIISESHRAAGGRQSLLRFRRHWGVLGEFGPKGAAKPYRWAGLRALEGSYAERFP